MTISLTAPGTSRVTITLHEAVYPPCHDEKRESDDEIRDHLLQIGREARDVHVNHCRKFFKR